MFVAASRRCTMCQMESIPPLSPRALKAREVYQQDHARRARERAAGITRRNIFEAILDEGTDAHFEPRGDADDDPAYVPVDAMPGTREKLEALARRLQMGLPLHHPNDRTAMDDEMTQGTDGRSEGKHRIH